MILRKNRFFHKFLAILIISIDLILKKYNLKILSVLKKIILSLKADVIFVIEDGNCSITWTGKYITENLNKFGVLNAELTMPFLERNKIVHYGSINCLIPFEGFMNIRKSNKIIVTWFHIVPEDDRLKLNGIKTYFFP